jgi:hypothetical protein
MRNIIVDYKKLTPEVLGLLVEKYPDGYGDDDVITFRNHKNEIIDAVEVVDKDTKYLVKISQRLTQQMELYDEDDYTKDELDDPEALPEIPEEKAEEEDESDDD